MQMNFFAYCISVFSATLVKNASPESIMGVWIFLGSIYNLADDVGYEYEHAEDESDWSELELGKYHVDALSYSYASPLGLRFLPLGRLVILVRSRLLNASEWSNLIVLCSTLLVGSWAVVIAINFIVMQTSDVTHNLWLRNFNIIVFYIWKFK